MTLLASLTGQLENPYLSRNQRAELRCEAAKALEDVGDYEGAREALGEFWLGLGERPPHVDVLNRSTAAEVLLRVGTLTGWIGHAAQVKDAQERAKNLISEASRIFESSSYAKKVLEAQTEIAYCYWREGSYDEARVILKGVIEQLTTDSELKAKAILRSAIVERSANRYNDALRILTGAEPLFDRINNHTVRGGYHNEIGLVLKNLAAAEKREDYLDRAFVEYAAASFHFEQAGHDIYRANVENNLGFLYFKAGKFTEAHEHLERARRLIASRKDNGTVAQVDETRARVFLAEKRHVEAERAARAAVTMLEKGGSQSLLTEALTTHGTALARLGRHGQARLTLYRAVEVGQQSGALNDAGLAALTLLEELGEHLNAEETQAVFGRAYEWLTPSQHEETLSRLVCVSARLVRESKRTDEGQKTAGSLKEVIRRYEGQLIRQALQRSGGSVTQAARALGLTHQALIYLLNHRHKDLLIERSPIIKRRRSITKKK